MVLTVAITVATIAVPAMTILTMATLVTHLHTFTFTCTRARTRTVQCTYTYQAVGGPLSLTLALTLYLTPTLTLYLTLYLTLTPTLPALRQREASAALPPREARPMAHPTPPPRNGAPSAATPKALMPALSGRAGGAAARGGHVAPSSPRSVAASGGAGGVRVGAGAGAGAGVRMAGAGAGVGVQGSSCVDSVRSVLDHRKG